MDFPLLGTSSSFFKIALIYGGRQSSYCCVLNTPLAGSDCLCCSSNPPFTEGDCFLFAACWILLFRAPTIYPSVVSCARWPKTAGFDNTRLCCCFMGCSKMSGNFLLFGELSCTRWPKRTGFDITKLCCCKLLLENERQFFLFKWGELYSLSKNGRVQPHHICCK